MLANARMPPSPTGEGLADRRGRRSLHGANLAASLPTGEGLTDRRSDQKLREEQGIALEVSFYNAAPFLVGRRMFILGLDFAFDSC